MQSVFCSFIHLEMADKTVKTLPQLFLSAIMLTNYGTRAHLFVKKYTKTVSQRHDLKYEVRDISDEVMTPLVSQFS